MRLALQILGGLVAGLLVGLAIGWLVEGRAATPPPFEVPAPPPVVVPVPAPVEPTPTAAPVAQPPEPIAARDPPDAGAVPPAADVVEPASLPPDVHLIPRGPGQFALLDLAPAGVPSLPVHQGKLARSGSVSPAFVKAPKIATLRGPVVRVELLHLGFDNEARPIAAHVRTYGRPGGEVEGLVPLRIAAKGQPERWVGLMRDPDPPEVPVLAPTPAEAPAATTPATDAPE